MYVCLGVGGRERPKPLVCGDWDLEAQRRGVTAPLFSASLSSCPGFDMTPNYVDSSPTGIVVSPWCSCRGSGNMEEECEKFLRDFTENPCLRKSCSIPPPQKPFIDLMSQGALEGCLRCSLLPPLGQPVICVSLLQHGVARGNWFGLLESHTRAVNGPASVCPWRS